MPRASYIIEQTRLLTDRYQTRDPVRLCEALGIRIHYLDLQQKLKGFFFYQSRQKNIVIDENLGPVMRRILTAHELGHAVLHSRQAMQHGFQETTLFSDASNFTETEANLFSAELLLPDQEVLSLLQTESFYDVARSLCVPATLLDYKLTLLRRKGCALTPPDIRRADYLCLDFGSEESEVDS